MGHTHTHTHTHTTYTLTHTHTHSLTHTRKDRPEQGGWSRGWDMTKKGLGRTQSYGVEQQGACLDPLNPFESFLIPCLAAPRLDTCMTLHPFLASLECPCPVDPLHLMHTYNNTQIFMDPLAFVLQLSASAKWRIQGLLKAWLQPQIVLLDVGMATEMTSEDQVMSKLQKYTIFMCSYLTLL